MYTILRRDAIFDNVNRARIYQVIADFPGLCYHELMEKTKLHTGTLVYHLDVLEREKLVRSFPEGRLRRYRLHSNQENKSAEEISRDINGAAYALRSKILKVVREKDEITQKEICGVLGVNKQIVSYHIKNLEQEKLLRTERKGLTKRCHAIEKHQ